MTPETRELYEKLLKVTSDLIQIHADNDEDPEDLPAFYEKINRKLLASPR